MSARIRVLMVAVFACLTPALAPAQEQQISAAPDTARVAPAPTVEASATAFRVASRTDSATTAMQRRQSAGKPVALMIVGGAAILVGAVIGDAPGTLFMVGGAVALLYGLYLYLQ
jgi:hypothetical protein